MIPSFHFACSCDKESTLSFLLHRFAPVCRKVWTTLPQRIHLATILGKDWKACPQNGYSHQLFSVVRSMAISLAKIVHATAGSLTMIPTMSQCATYLVQCLSEIWLFRPPSSITTLPTKRWYLAQNLLSDRPSLLFMTMLRKLYVRKYVTNVIWKLQLLLLQVLMLFTHEFVSNKNMKANTGQKVMKHIVILFPLSQKESVPMLL